MTNLDLHFFPRALLVCALSVPGCSSSGTDDVDFLNPPTAPEPLEGAFVFEVEVPVYGRRGMPEMVQGQVAFTSEAFELNSTHGSCAGRMEPDVPGRARVRCAGLEMDLRWLGASWGGRLTVQVTEIDEEEVCEQRSPTGCSQTRVVTRERPVRRTVDFELFRLGAAGPG